MGYRSKLWAKGHNVDLETIRLMLEGCCALGLLGAAIVAYRSR